jgi:tripartite-type tricarboxylate transporter receptor subunit TctC
MKKGSAGVGATGRVGCAIFNGVVRVKIQAVPYRGSGPAMQDLVACEFDYFCTISGSAAGPIQNELIKPVAVFTRRGCRQPPRPIASTATRHDRAC